MNPIHIGILSSLKLGQRLLLIASSYLFTLLVGLPLLLYTPIGYASYTLLLIPLIVGSLSFGAKGGLINGIGVGLVHLIFLSFSVAKLSLLFDRMEFYAIAAFPLMVLAVAGAYMGYFNRQRKLREEEIQHLTRINHITGLYNARFFQEKLKEEKRRSERYGEKLSLLYIDIDSFKRCNDTYGHTVGDQVLEKFSTLIRKELREADSIFRYGGEEFIVLLPHTDREGGRGVAERLRKKIEEELSASRGITISVGVAEHKKGEEVTKKADEAMYEAKRLGKNKVCVSGESSPTGGSSFSKDE